ncbi:MAG: kelch repeat-containing protein [Oscillochloridaceae bacterium umkhey_bin13]
MSNDTQLNDVPISEREREILHLVATGATNQQIAQQLNISINTVKVHLRNIFAKIGVVSRTEATVFAIRNGLVEVDELRGSAVEADLPTSVSEVAAPEATTLPSVLAAEPLPEPASGALAAPGTPASRFPLIWIGLAVAVLAVVGLSLTLVLGRQPAPSPDPTTAPALGLPGTAANWRAHPPLPRPRQAFALTAFDLDGRLYVVGGQQNGAALAWLDRYDPETQRWVALDDKPTSVSQIQAVTLRGRIFVPGGEGAAGQVSDVLEVYNPRDQRWEQLQPLPSPRSRYSLTVWEGRIFLIGGWNGQQIVDDILIYDPERDEWSTGPALPTPRQHAGVALAAGQIYLVGGEGPTGPLREALRLDPSDGAASRWQLVTPLPEAAPQPYLASAISSLLAFDAAGQRAWQYDFDADAWSLYPTPLLFKGAAAFLSTSIFFVADDQAAEPGLVNEHRVVYTIFMPGAGSTQP